LRFKNLDSYQPWFDIDQPWFDRDLKILIRINHRLIVIYPALITI